MEKWRNCVVVITGANSGIGFSTLTDLSKIGLKVVALDIRVDAIEKFKNETKNPEIYPIVCDITNDDQTETAFKWIDENFGGCDILINNAGMLTTIGIFDYDKPMKDVELNVDLNFTSVVRCSRLAFKSMKNRGYYGYIININSVCGHSVEPVVKNGSLGVYNGTKYAITATAEVMRHELNAMENRKIRVTNISPGVIKTNIFKAADMDDHAIKNVFEGPVLDPKNISDTIMYLLSTPYEVNITNITLRATGAEL